MFINRVWQLLQREREEKEEEEEETHLHVFFPISILKNINPRENNAPPNAGRIESNKGKEARDWRRTIPNCFEDEIKMEPLSTGMRPKSRFLLRFFSTELGAPYNRVS